jgi:hypothetical protein
MRRSTFLGIWLCLGAPAFAAPLPTCDASALDPRSLRLTTRGVALAVTQPRHGWWDSFDLGKYEADLEDLNLAVTRVAERALEIDPRNLAAHATLARQYLVLEEPEQARAAWGAVFEAAGAVAWTATLYDVDGRDWFVVAADRAGLRIYQWRQVAREEKRGFGGVLEFPGPEDERFWRALGGCFEPGLVPHAQVAWSDVKAIRAGNWVLWFELTREIRVTSGRNGKTRTLREIKLNLHGRTGSLEVYKPVGQDELATRGRGPAGYNDLVRRTLAAFVDPDKRIALPPSKPGAGW